jgi:hypothetical protein
MLNSLTQTLQLTFQQHLVLILFVAHVVISVTIVIQPLFFVTVVLAQYIPKTIYYTQQLANVIKIAQLGHMVMVYCAINVIRFVTHAQIAIVTTAVYHVL